MKPPITADSAWQALNRNKRSDVNREEEELSAVEDIGWLKADLLKAHTALKEIEKFTARLYMTLRTEPMTPDERKAAHALRLIAAIAKQGHD